MTNQELLNRIEKLEALTKRLQQGIIDIRSACSCLAVSEPEDIVEKGPEDIIERHD